MPKNSTIGFIGLGTMGDPMVRCLAKAGHPLCLYDIDQEITERLAGEVNAQPATSLAEVGESCAIIITMLPNADIVRHAVMGDNGLMDGLVPGSIIIDMSSSYPIATRTLGAELAKKDIALLDAPVSGGVRKAVAGTLAIMLGGDDADAMARSEPVLEAMGGVHPTGALGSGHATKALNNYVSAAGLAAACEAAIIGKAFGLDPERMTDVINASTGRNNSTENKLKQFILSGEFAKSGFALELMAKDVKAAADLSEELGHDLPGVTEASTLWAKASATLGSGTDHTEIFSYLAKLDENRD